MTIYYAKMLPALAFQPTSPAKLATIGPITPQLEAGSGGTLKLYAQHLNDRLSAWSSLSDIVGEATLIGTLAHNTPTGSISFTPGPSEQVLFWFEFDDTGGAPPALLSFSAPWTSDVTAPVAPTIASILGVGGANALCNLGPVPATARHMTAEVNLNGAGFLPLSARNLIESGQGSLEFMGPQSAAEPAGARNSVQALIEGLTLGDTVVVRAKAVDTVGNISSATDSSLLTIEAPGTPIGTPTLYIEDATLATGATGTIRVHLMGASAENVTVDYASTDDTATDPSDYEGISGTITFTADDEDPHQYVDIAINATGDDPTSGTTAYTVVLSDAVNATIDNGTGTVSVQALDYVPVIADNVTVTVSEYEEIKVEVS